MTEQKAQLATPVLREVMYPIKHCGQIRRFVQQRLEVLDSVFLCQIQTELLLDLLMNVAMFDIWYIRIYHECD